MTTANIEHALELHGVEVWGDYAVNVYTLRQEDQTIPGESFTRLDTLDDPHSLREYLGY